MKWIISFEMNLNLFYFCRLVHSEQNVHGVVDQRAWMAFPHERIVWKEYGLALKGLTVDSVSVLFGFGAFSQSSAHKVQMTSMSGSSVTPPSGRVRLNFWFEFPLGSAERCPFHLNLHMFLIIFSSLKCKFGIIFFGLTFSSSLLAFLLVLLFLIFIHSFILMNFYLF